MSDDVEARYGRMRQVLRGERPGRMPWGDFAWAEYRPEQYHLGHCEVIPQAGEVATSDDGKRHFTRDGGVWAVGDAERFQSHEDVLNVPEESIEVEQVGPDMLQEMSRLVWEAGQQAFPVPMHYGTLMTRATIEFGWEPFLTAAALAPERMNVLLDRFGEASLAVARGWGRLNDVELITIHDDIAGTRGLFARPGWCRQYLLPWYDRIFTAIHAAGKKVLYISDGDYSSVLDDILQLDPDGLYIQSNCMDPGEFMRRAGRDKIYLLKTHSQRMDFGTPEDIREELAGLAELHEEFPGMMMYPGGHDPPEENARAFREYYEEYLVYE